MMWWGLFLLALTISLPAALLVVPVYLYLKIYDEEDIERHLSIAWDYIRKILSWVRDYNKDDLKRHLYLFQYYYFYIPRKLYQYIINSDKTRFQQYSESEDHQPKYGQPPDQIAENVKRKISEWADHCSSQNTNADKDVESPVHIDVKNSANTDEDTPPFDWHGDDEVPVEIVLDHIDTDLDQDTRDDIKQSVQNHRARGDAVDAADIRWVAEASEKMDLEEDHPF
ncbi:hypothetical protein [Natronorubrum sp. DTA28]|uniref:hypothetical protein n=1 Tax=Natronorubrum sp. DTA28 TaxID=3447019 RepID=UPI003F86B76D